MFRKKSVHNETKEQIKKMEKRAKKKIINKQKFSTSFKSFLLCRTEIESQPNKKKRN